MTETNFFTEMNSFHKWHLKSNHSFFGVHQYYPFTHRAFALIFQKKEKTVE